jgi:hypothetical protein
LGIHEVRADQLTVVEDNDAYGANEASTATLFARIRQQNQVAVGARPHHLRKCLNYGQACSHRAIKPLLSLLGERT